MKYMVVIAAMVFLTGCSSIFGPKLNFPSDLNGECKQAMAEAKFVITSKGKSVADEHNVTVRKHPGEKKFGEMWGWFDAYWNQYVGGLCDGSTIEVGCNPETMGEVMYEVEKHEFAHYWLIPTGDWGHDPLYKNDFINWRDATRKYILVSKDPAVAKQIVKEECAKVKEGELVGFDMADSTGKFWHIDFIGSGKN